MTSKTALQLLQQHPLPSISFGCPIIDSTIGSFPCRGICEISGEAGAGKTQIALTLTLEALFNSDHSRIDGSAAYITCGEGHFPIKRLSQLASKYSAEGSSMDPKEILSSVHIEECMNFEDVADAVRSRIPEMCRSKSMKLLVIDSLAGMIRHEYDAMDADDMRDRTNFVFSFAKQLKWLSDTFKIGILVVNQVTAAGLSGSLSDVMTSSVHSSSIPALGLTWSTCVSHRYAVTKTSFSVHRDTDGDEENRSVVSQQKRILEIVFSPLYASNACHFYIDSDGLHGF